ncbi:MULTISPECIES: class I SAM-dependent methyltransferase [Actinoalloteichus]|uniref:class I SAM-dependent methyltransferase n=1 Tax=Actinoalloteichus TaxID=65496 RepID=UPI0003FA7036|nr:class I SAM-dependent methyltransferase [Actinoalloteichus caeruleus]
MADTGRLARAWEEQARNWIAWARRPGFDSWWHLRERFMALVPAPGVATLDLGCGEGRISRDLRARGHRVHGVDTSPTLVGAAREADPGGAYVVAEGAALPFADRTFDVVVAHNVLMDVEDLAGTVVEVARVLRPAGRLCVSITHPVVNVTRPASGDPRAPRVMARSYFTRERFEVEQVLDGSRMVWNGWYRPLEDYTRALEDAGLLLEALREPDPDWVTNDRDRQVPWHLWLRARSV